MERKLNIKVLLPEEVIEKYDIDEDTGVLSYFEDGAIHILIEDDDEMPEEEMHDTVCDTPCERSAATIANGTASARGTDGGGLCRIM